MILNRKNKSKWHCKHSQPAKPSSQSLGLLCSALRHFPLITDKLDKAHVSWKYYTDPEIIQNAMAAIEHVWKGADRKKVAPVEGFIKDIKAGRMPAVSWLNPPASYNEPSSPHHSNPIRS